MLFKKHIYYIFIFVLAVSTVGCSDAILKSNKKGNGQDGKPSNSNKLSIENYIGNQIYKHKDPTTGNSIKAKISSSQMITLTNSGYKMKVEVIR